MFESHTPPAAVISQPFSVDISTSTAIAASAESVWATLMEAAAYPAWSPFIRSIHGVIAEGQRISVELQLHGRKPQRVRPRIVAVEPPRCLEWLGQIGPRGVFDARHRFEIRANGETSCELVHSERLTGLLVPLVRSMLTGPTPAAFIAHNLALKSKVEHGG